MAPSTSSEKPTGFMSEYMSDLGQSQDLNSFLEKNQPTYDPNSHSHAPASGTASESTFNTKNSKEKSQDRFSQSEKSQPAPSSAPSESKKSDLKDLAKSHSIGDSNYHYQRQAIKSAALDNCADINMDLSECMSGKSGTWRDLASLCVEKNRLLQSCLKLNKVVLHEKGYARAGNTPEQDQVILGYADEQVQKALKEEKA
ncbi:hypothetical protein BGZ76_007488 [Entomortierella beljakovae]|nr:hypothetical protein BGZ76_007488 [Entomortierella beljakovae]